MLDLFILETCPYCQKVIEFLDKEHMKYNKIDILNKDSENSLIQIGGKRQVPFLVDTERNIQMYESDDIIEYLDEITKIKPIWLEIGLQTSNLSTQKIINLQYDFNDFKNIYWVKYLCFSFLLFILLLSGICSK